MSMHRALRSERGFGVFWLGFSLSVLGDAITRTTLIWYVFDLTGSSVALVWLSFCFTAPVIVGGRAAMDAMPLWYVFVVASVFGFLMMVPRKRTWGNCGGRSPRALEVG